MTSYFIPKFDKLLNSNSKFLFYEKQELKNSQRKTSENTDEIEIDKDKDKK